jgi:hypothetical protein
MNTLFNETETAIVKVNASDYGLDETKAQEITKGLKTIIAEREVLKKQYEECINLEITQDSIPRFKELRLMIRDNRTKGIETWHKANKAYFLAGGQFVDAIRRKESSENEYMEEKLLNAEKFFENQERDRLEKLRVDRLSMLKPYTEIEPLALGHMEPAVFDSLLAGFKVAYEARVAAEKKAEEDRIAREKAEAEAREAQRLENIRLKAEADKKEKELEAERKAVRLAQEKRDAELAMERAEAEKKRNQLELQARKEREELEAKVRKEREERERIEAQLKAKQDAERKAEAARIANEKAEAKRLKLAPDKTKLINFMQAINDLPRPEVKSIEAADIASKANIKLFEVAAYIRDNANKL